ncbi:MAG: S9 family peptidase [Sphingomonadaceae bacterium]|nr:S9 family peptidase [Sphingomonadaceae bacterium]
MRRWLLLELLSILLPVAALGQTVQPVAMPEFVKAAVERAESAPRAATIPASSFAERNEVGGARLSPDGRLIAMRISVEGNANLAIFDAATRRPLSRMEVPEKLDLKWFQWAGSGKVLMSVTGTGRLVGVDVRYSKLYVMDVEQGSLLYIGHPYQLPDGDDVVHVADDGSFLLLSIMPSAWDWPLVYRFSLNEKGRGEAVQTQKRGVTRWYADETGVVRAGVAWIDDGWRVHYRSGPDADFIRVDKLVEPSEDSWRWDFSQVRAGSDIGYVVGKQDNGRYALMRFNYATQEVVETVYANPDWDVEEAWFNSSGQPIAALYNSERENIVWLDPELAKTHTALSGVLQESELRIISRDRAGQRMLVWAGGPGDPGALYVFTPAEGRLDLFQQVRPNLDFTQLVEPVPIRYSARDGTMIEGYLTLPRGRKAKGLPLIILPHGGPYGIRDTLTYNDEVQFLANRGYAVLQPNYRGSGGYGEAFEKLGDGEIGRGMQDDIDDAMDWAVGLGIADPARVCVVGSSYGGYAAMWAVLRNPERYRCAASFAGVSDWQAILRYDRGFFTRKFFNEWRDRVEGEEDSDEGVDLADYSPVKNGKALTRPLLLAHGKEDARVPFSQFTAMRGAAKDTGLVETLVFKDEGHNFDKKESEQQWYDTLGTFLAKHNPAD